MPMLEHSVRQKLINTTVVYALLMGLIVFIILMVVQASQLSGPVTGASIKTVAIGPLRLMELSKTPLDGGGYEVGMQYFAGLLWYGVAWVGLAVAVVWLRLKHSKPAFDSKD